MLRSICCEDLKNIYDLDICPTIGRVEIHTVDSVLRNVDRVEGKVPQNTPLRIQLYLKEVWYGEAELCDEALVVVDGSEIKEYNHKTQGAR